MECLYFPRSTQLMEKYHQRKNRVNVWKKKTTFIDIED